MNSPQYRIQQTSPTQWELATFTEGAWRLVGNFDSQLSAQNAMAGLIAADAFIAPPPQYFDALGNVTTSPVQP